MKAEDNFISNSVLFEAIVNERELLYEKLDQLNKLSLLYAGIEIHDLEIKKTQQQKQEDKYVAPDDGFGIDPIARERRKEIFKLISDGNIAQSTMDIAEFKLYEYATISNDLLHLHSQGMIKRHVLKPEDSKKISPCGMGRRSYYYTTGKQLHRLFTELDNEK